MYDGAMKLEGHTILITGGAGGIGFALAERFVRAKSTVIVCGRRSEQLAWAKEQCPALHTVRCDVSQEAERTRLFGDVTRDFPDVDVLVNNAGIQNRPGPLAAPQDWARHAEELAINLAAPMHLTMLFLPHLLKQGAPAVVNVSSGLAFAPIAFMPTYCATKAALHSFTMSLRFQLRGTPLEVVEMVPPAVNTDLGGKGLHDMGVPLDAFADHAMSKLAEGAPEFGYQFSEKARLSSRQELDAQFAAMNERLGS
jgi:uncharacterized oxidoreductase